MTQQATPTTNSRNPILGASLLSFIQISLKFPRLLKKPRSLWRFAKEQVIFEALGGKMDLMRPILTEYLDQAGSAQGHYFHQDLLVASLIAINNPARHIDVGSRIDGFGAHVAAFRPIEILDIRELKDTGHPNITSFQANLMDERQTPHAITDSLSCLHAIEHFGLGRYNDPIDPKGHIKGLQNLIKMLKPGGTLYISFPIADQTQIQFNAHRVFHPRDIFHWTPDVAQLNLKRFDYVDDSGSLHHQADIDAIPQNLQYGCGIYTFQKLPASLE